MNLLPLLWVLGMGAQPASAEEGPATTEVRVDAWAEGGLTASQPGQEGVAVGGYLNKARLLTWLHHEDLLTGMAQVDVAQGFPILMDAVLMVRPTAELEVRGGRFKTSVSREFLEPGPDLLLVHRPSTVRITPGRRVGAEVAWTPAVGSATGRLQAGIFGDSGTAREHTAPLATFRTGLDLAGGLGLHAAVATPVLPQPTGEPTVLDVAVTWRRDGVRLLAEGVTSFGPDGQQVAGALQGGWRFGDREEGFAIEPALGIDAIARPGGVVQPRFTAGLNAYLGPHLIQMVDLVVEPGPQGANGAVFFQLRARL